LPTAAEAPSAKNGASAVKGIPSENGQATTGIIEEGGITVGFFAFSGRSVVWSAAWDQVLESPVLGYGFHSDRLLLGTHMHNSYLHALLQTGFLGVLPFVAALALTWILLFRALRNLDTLPGIHKHLVIQSAGVLLFFSIRTIPESTMAFFGIDYLLLAPFLLYLQFINSPDRLARISESPTVKV
jgi:O-antigen ligase